MRFRVFPAERNTEQFAGRAHLTGIDRISWPLRVSIEGGELALARSVSDSARLHAPWPVEGHGLPVLSTGSLIERAEPYSLPLEFARGTIFHVRDQLAEWELMGLAVPKGAKEKLASAVRLLSNAAVAASDPADSARNAEEAIRDALDAGNLLAAAYTEQSFASRRRHGSPAVKLLGADLGTDLLDEYTARQFILSFNAARVPICWRDTESTEGQFFWNINDRQIEWCRKHGLKIAAGPLLLLDHRELPDWLYLFEEDFDNIQEFASALVRATVERYRGRVDYWICAGRANSDVLSLTEQERLQLTARTVEIVRELDPGTPALVSIDQPWAEYLRERQEDFPPMYFADALIRADLGLTGLMLEMNVGFTPGGTMARHIIEYGRQLDSWSMLGLPLWLSLAGPSAYHDDPLAVRKAELQPANCTPASQQSLVARLIPFALSRPSVRGVFWNQLQDAHPHDFPHAGLFDDRRQAKPALRTMAAIKRKYLNG